MDLLSSALLAGFPHGFTTRRGGASCEAFASFNLGSAVGDDGARVDANWQALRVATGLIFARVRQVHGDRVLVVDEAARAGARRRTRCSPPAPGVAACVAVADCVPVLLGDSALGRGRGGPRRLARHARARRGARGRGAVARGGRPARAIRSPPSAPRIGPCCYDVSPDLGAGVPADLGPRVAEPRGGQLARRPVARERAGAAAGRALARAHRGAGPLHPCEPDTFFSHRRDRGRTGRQVGFIAPAPSPLS